MRLVDGYTRMEDYTRDLTHVRFSMRYWIQCYDELPEFVDRLVDTILKCQAQPTRWPKPPFKESPLYEVLQTMKQLHSQGDVEAMIASLQKYEPYTMHRVVGEELSREFHS